MQNSNAITELMISNIQKDRSRLNAMIEQKRGRQEYTVEEKREKGGCRSNVDER
jgi:hypothetical protein